MKISKSNVNITEIPYFDRITVGPFGEAGELLARFDGVDSAVLSYAEVAEMRDALNEALKVMQPEGAAPERLLRTYVRGDSEPTVVTAVRDAEGDTWTKGPFGWNLRGIREGNAYADYSWDSLLREFGPLTEIKP